MLLDDALFADGSLMLWVDGFALASLALAGGFGAVALFVCVVGSRGKLVFAFDSIEDEDSVVDDCELVISTSVVCIVLVETESDVGFWRLNSRTESIWSVLSMIETN